MTAYLADFWTALVALLPVLLALASLTLLALILDALCAGREW